MLTTRITTKSLPSKALIFLTSIFINMLRLNHFPTQCKSAEIVTMTKHNRLESAASPYRPISLLITFSKIFEKILSTKITSSSRAKAARVQQ